MSHWTPCSGPFTCDILLRGTTGCILLKHFVLRSSNLKWAQHSLKWTLPIISCNELLVLWWGSEWAGLQHWKFVISVWLQTVYLFFMAIERHGLLPNTANGNCIVWHLKWFYHYKILTGITGFTESYTGNDLCGCVGLNTAELIKCNNNVVKQTCRNLIIRYYSNLLNSSFVMWPDVISECLLD